MLESLGLLLVGFIVGCYGTLVGIGGGPIIVPVVALAYQYSTSTVVAISFFVIFFNTLSGSIAYLKQKRVDVITGVKFGLVTIPGSLISTFALDHIHLEHFKVIHGLFLFVLAIYIFFKPPESETTQRPGFSTGRGIAAPKLRSHPTLGLRLDEIVFSPLRALRMSSVALLPSKKRRTTHRSPGLSESDGSIYVPAPQKKYSYRIITDAMGNIYRYRFNERLGMGISALIGVFSTFLGIGGGLIQVPVLVYLLSFPVHIGTATSHYITMINCGFTLIPLLVHGDIVYRPAILLALGVVAGAQMGARLSKRISGRNLLKLLIPVFVLMGIKLVFFR